MAMEGPGMTANTVTMETDGESDECDLEENAKAWSEVLIHLN